MFQLNIILFFFSCYVLKCSSDTRRVEIQDWPYMAQVKRNNDSYETAVLISRRHVVLHHLIDAKNVLKYKVLVGSATLKSGQTIGIVSYLRYEDVGIITLSQTVGNTFNVQPIERVSKRPKAGKSVFVVGFLKCQEDLRRKMLMYLWTICLLSLKMA